MYNFHENAATAIKHVARMMPPKKLSPSKCLSLEGSGIGVGGGAIVDGIAVVDDAGETVVALVVVGDGAAVVVSGLTVVVGLGGSFVVGAVGIVGFVGRSVVEFGLGGVVGTTVVALVIVGGTAVVVAFLLSLSSVFVPFRCNVGTDVCSPTDLSFCFVVTAAYVKKSIFNVVIQV